MPALRWPPLRHVGVALVFAVAALLRFKGLSWGLRHPPHVDEQPFVDYARTLLARDDFDHRFYEYPGLLFYLLAAVLRFVPASAGDGAAAGAATAVKFSRALLFPAYLVQRALRPSRRRLLMAAVAAAAAFLVFSPYTILNARAALRGAWVQLSWHYDRPLRPAEYPQAAADYGLALVRALGIPALLL